MCQGTIADYCLPLKSSRRMKVAIVCLLCKASLFIHYWHFCKIAPEQLALPTDGKLSLVCASLRSLLDRFHTAGHSHDHIPRPPLTVAAWLLGAVHIFAVQIHLTSRLGHMSPSSASEVASGESSSVGTKTPSESESSLLTRLAIPSSSCSKLCVSQSCISVTALLEFGQNLLK